MSVHPYSAIERVRQVRRVQRLSLLCVGSAFIALSLYQYRLEAHRAKTTSIVKKALVYCSAFEGQCEPEGEPRFCRENVPLPLVKQMERPLWYVPLRANGQHYALILRADTGRLCYVFNISPWENTAKQSVAPGLPSDSNRAISQSLLYLQRLKAVPGEAQIALDAKPGSVRSNTGWRVVWDVREAQNENEEALRVTVSQKDGRLLQLVDTLALNQNVR